MKKRLAIFGASGHGKVVADTACAVGWSEIVFFDDEWPRIVNVGIWAVAGNAKTLLKSVADYDGVIVAIGNCQVRLAKQQMLAAEGACFVTLIHPKAHVSQYASLGVGSVIMAGAVVNIDAHVGNACIVNTSATIDHDCVLEDGVHISPGVHLAGSVHVGAGSWIGVGASVSNNLRIGSGVTVGAGAVVIKPIVDGMTVVGNPAAPIRRLSASTGN